MESVKEVEQRADLREMEQRIMDGIAQVLAALTQNVDALTKIANGQETIAVAILAMQESLARFDAMAEIVGQMFPTFAPQPELVIPQPGDEEDASS